QRRARHRAHEARSPAAREARHRDRADAQDQGGVRPQRHPQSGKALVMKRLETDQLWTAIDAYISDQLVNQDPPLDAALEASEAAGLPPINVAPNQGKLLMMLAEMIGARRILEIGTLGGYSTIWLARGLVPGGRLITLELDPRCAEVARANLARAGLAQTA